MNNGWRKWAWLALFCCWASSVAVRAETVRQAFAEEGLDVSFHFYSWA
ncbi:hypothetical protein [Aeromonas veronii]|nr:hypothetical protein [Aeromonas veronii]MCS0540522.1 hypothetical protein [Aeromonas veronii]